MSSDSQRKEEPYVGSDRRHVSTCEYGDKIEERMTLALQDLGREIGEFKNDMKDTVKELKHDLKEITYEVFRRLPLWATFAFAFSSTIIGVLVTLLVKSM